MAFRSSVEAKGVMQSFDQSQMPELFTAPRYIRSVAKPETSDEGARLKFLLSLQEGDMVKYESLTHNTQMNARVEKILYDNGQITRIDLDVKKRANVDRISMVTSEDVESSHAQSGTHAVATSANGAREDLGIGQPSEYHYTSRPWSESFQTAIAPRDSCATGMQFQASEDNLRHLDNSPRQSSPSPAEQAKFIPGQKVRYFSTSYNTFMDATILEIRSDGTYNLNVKKGAKEEHITAVGEDESNATAQPPSPPFGGSPTSKLQQQACQQSSVLTEKEPSYLRTQPPPPPRQSETGVQLPKPRKSFFPPLFMGVGIEMERPIEPAIPSSSAPERPVSSHNHDRDELRIRGGSFDPLQPQMRSQIASQLGFDGAAKLEKMAGFSGGLNEGIWFMSGEMAGRHEDLVLKLVRCKRIASNIPTEAENLEGLMLEHPELASDSLVAFPIKIFDVADDDGKCNNLIVMRKVPGERLAELICRKYYSKQEAHLIGIFEELGKQLAVFHKRYGNMQHGDFQPSNIFYDEASDTLSFIDVGGMGIPTVDDDVSHLCQAMNLLAHSYGPSLHEDCIAAFDKGYQKAAD